MKKKSKTKEKFFRTFRLLKQRNDELFEENRHLQQEQQRQQQNLAWRSTLQQAYGNEASIPQLSSSNPPSHLSRLEQMPSSVSPMKNLNLDGKRDRSKSKIELEFIFFLKQIKFICLFV